MLTLAIIAYLIIGLGLVAVCRFVGEQGPLPVLMMLALATCWPLFLLAALVLALNEWEL